MAGKKQSAPSKSSKEASKSTSATSSRQPKPQKSNSQQTTSPTIEKGESEEELKRQQTLLSVFSNTFREVLNAEDFSSQLQELKAALFNRDFEGAFAHEAALDVYAARWSPTRALCYGQVLRGLDPYLKSIVRTSPEHNLCARKGEHEHETTDAIAQVDQDESKPRDNTEPEDQEAQEAPTRAVEKGDAKGEENPHTLKILAIGGAAAEIVAFADYISSQNTTNPTPTTRGEITLLDIGPWGSIVQRLQTALASTPPISQYASAAARAANKALLSPASLHSTFLQKDILALTQDELAELITSRDEVNTDTAPAPILITLLFTLNELYTTSGIQRTTSFLRLLSTLATPGSLLLVVDSPGSYSEAAVGREAKRYPMQWLLDHTLIPPPKRKPGGGKEGGEIGGPERGGEGPARRWEKVESHDSAWFRVADGLRYPIPLENMRYQMHLYRVCDA
ncbi:hypothetical protein GGR51DRAFT_529297 [Nemania sp. FL0031]|nr:hypothetical protein GGR51DRAFT_529297 [Nemania sp. FL0031]